MWYNIISTHTIQHIVLSVNICLLLYRFSMHVTEHSLLVFLRMYVTLKAWTTEE